jgi:hypothetical protein
MVLGVRVTTQGNDRLGQSVKEVSASFFTNAPKCAFPHYVRAPPQFC